MRWRKRNASNRNMSIYRRPMANAEIGKSISDRYQSRQGTPSSLGSTVHLSYVYKFSLFDRKFINFSSSFSFCCCNYHQSRSPRSVPRGCAIIFVRSFALHLLCRWLFLRLFKPTRIKCLVERLDVFHARTHRPHRRFEMQKKNIPKMEKPYGVHQIQCLLSIYMQKYAAWVCVCVLIREHYI